MEKRALIAVVLSLGFFYLYSMLFPAPEKKDVPRPAQQTVSTAQNVQSTQPAPLQPTQPVSQIAGQAKDITVETDLFTAVFSNQGAALKSLVLKKYRETSGRDGKPVYLVSETNPAGFDLRTESAALGLSPTVLYTESAGSLKVSGADKKLLEFHWTSPQGVSVKKSYTFSGNSYAIGLNTQVTNNSAAKLSGPLNLILVYPEVPKSKESRFEANGSVTMEDGKFTTEKVKDLAEKPKDFNTRVSWTGYADKYFLAAVLSRENSIATVRIGKGTGNYIDTTVASPSFELLPGQSRSITYSLFFGPKDLDILKAQGEGLESTLDLGWFAAIAKPLLYTLKYFNNYTHNYGIAIIIITVIIKILFFPLTHKSYKSMKDMQKLQPKMTELKEKFKNDRDAMNKAVMEMYRTHKVNPLGGCLPMVVQIPVFFALYKALMGSIELRHAPFMFWITDLSAKDPYYVTPIIMGVTMFIQQKMTPSSMDPIQAKMMLALPVVFTFMFLNFPSGLVIYWLVNNVLTIGQQVYINRTLKD
ncbi:MAG: membrane protein insertase YidC [Deltaproteobacteria bacterium]|nr:membrane protein insertase YidC [Deltaproteobacteria bacterium]